MQKLLNTDVDSFVDAIARRVVDLLVGQDGPSNSERPLMTGLLPYEPFKYHSAIRDARTGNVRPLQDYLRQYMPRPR